MLESFLVRSSFQIPLLEQLVNSLELLLGVNWLSFREQRRLLNWLLQLGCFLELGRGFNLFLNLEFVAELHGDVELVLRSEDLMLGEHLGVLLRVREPHIGDDRNPAI